jgi:hypothetical protein
MYSDVQNDVDIFGAPSIVTHTIPSNDFTNSLTGYNRNNLFMFLAETFGTKQAQEVSALYFLGTSSHWPGASVFWQVDFTGSPRAGKIMLYDPSNGKRRKDGKYITWYHTVKPRAEYVLKQCFFGEHLLSKYENKPVAIVESEKTALICSLFYPEFTWIASGSLANLNGDKCSILQGRECFLIPDSNGVEAWKRIRDNSPYLYKSKILSLEYQDEGQDISDIVLDSLKQFRQVFTPV